VCVANVLLAIRGMGKFVLSLVPVQLTMGAVTHWHAAWITLVSMTKSSQAERFHKMLCEVHILKTFYTMHM
jgi:hypothetical protein